MDLEIILRLVFWMYSITLTKKLFFFARKAVKLLVKISLSFQLTVLFHPLSFHQNKHSWYGSIFLECLILIPKKKLFSTWKTQTFSQETSTRTHREIKDIKVKSWNESKCCDMKQKNGYKNWRRHYTLIIKSRGMPLLCNFQ